MEDNFKNYYEVLGIKVSASRLEIRRAYRTLALKWHPDRNPAARKAEAHQHFVEIHEAYSVLINYQKRNAYDVLYFDKFGWKRADQFGPEAQQQEPDLSSEEALRAYAEMARKNGQAFSESSFQDFRNGSKDVFDSVLLWLHLDWFIRRKDKLLAFMLMIFYVLKVPPDWCRREATIVLLVYSLFPLSFIFFADRITIFSRQLGGGSSGVSKYVLQSFNAFFGWYFLLVPMLVVIARAF